MSDNQVHLILGEDEFLADRTRRDIIRAIGPQAEVTEVTAGELTAGELLELTSPSLFADDRAIVITRTEAAGKEPTERLLRAAVDPAPGIYLIIQHTGGGRNKALVKKFQKVAQVHPVDAVPARQLHRWVSQEFAGYGVRPTPDVVTALLEGVGSDLRELASAVSQLVADTDGRVTIEAVRTYYQGVAEVSSFDIADLAVTGQTAKALASTRRALQLGVSPVALAAALGAKVGMIARLYSSHGVSPRALASTLGAHPFVVEKTLPVARRWSGRAVSEAVILVADLDAQAKGGGGGVDYAVENAVRRLCELAR